MRAFRHLSAMSIACALSASTLADPTTIEERAAAAARDAMDAGHIPSLTIALVSGEEIVWAGAFGYANLWAGTPATTDTVYLIGSTFKAMATVALLQHLEAGKFALDDPVNAHLGDLRIRNEDPSRPVTFRHLLTHTSGLPGDFGPHPVWGDTVPLPLKTYLERMLRVKGPPLTEWVYSNTAYTLVAYLIERMSGAEFKDYMREKLFKPLEMNDTDFAPRPDMEERLAIPYEYDAQTGKHTPAVRLKADVWPAGIVYGAVLNQANWLITNLNGGIFKGRRIIGEHTLDEMMRRQFDVFTGPVEGIWLNETSGLGLTWWVSELDGERLFAHSGSVPGYTAWIVGNRDRRTGVAILTNGHRAHPHLAELGQRCLAILADGPR